MPDALAKFIEVWSQSNAGERANKDSFLIALCEAIDVPRPSPSTGDDAKDLYVFEKDARVAHEGGAVTTRKIDLYKEGCFILEAKQGSAEGSKKLGTAKRDTPGWNIAMRDAFGQALGYARCMAKPPPFIITCDIGFCFDVYAAFDGTTSYSPFPNPQASRFFLTDLAKNVEILRHIFLDPMRLDPAKESAKITREVASHLANLARALEGAKHDPHDVATFLMRCLFTMFAEDVGLLPDRLFTNAIKEHWLPNPPSFTAGVEDLWRAMNAGTNFAFFGKLMRFNGGLFEAPSALPLDKNGLFILLEAAQCDWSSVEPAIFGTLLERALDPDERHRLGAHYTPRAYVERLVRPTIEEPIRADWDIIQAEARQLVEQDKVPAARKVVHAFHQKLCTLRVLDPACGTGNFLYVTLDLFKRLEAEVLRLLAELGEQQTLMTNMQTVRVTPAQFLGIEVNPRAREIAELVLWIGYLQAHFRGSQTDVPEPVLQNYKNIEERDAVLAWDSIEIVRDANGKPITRWDGVTMKKSAVTGEDVPDEKVTIVVERYVNPRKAEWPKADFIVGNPPFLGKLHMLSSLGSGYMEALRGVYHGKVDDGVDHVMYWWAKAAEITAEGAATRFGFVTTKSITQTFNRRVVSDALSDTRPIHLLFAIPNHPWVEGGDDAAVRIAMTVGAAGAGNGLLMTVAKETVGEDGVSIVSLEPRTGRVHSNLSVGADVTRAQPLSSNSLIASMGPMLGSRGFVLTTGERDVLVNREKGVASRIRPLRNGRDLTDRPRGVFAIDFDGLEIADVEKQFPATYQHLLDHVWPERANNNDPRLRSRWWLFRRSNELWRAMLKGRPRSIVTVETAKHRVFFLQSTEIIAEHGTISLGLDDPLFLGLLSSRVHVTWALAAGGRLGVGNDPRYNKTRCFDPFPFPLTTDALSEKIRVLGEALDRHRKAQQDRHPALTITGMYNVLEKLRSGEELTAKDKIIHEEGLVSVLRKIHDDLDDAVFLAYDWPRDLADDQILERVVALNQERAEEERRGLVRWVRPEFQNPTGASKMTQVGMTETETEDDEPTAVAGAESWPKKLPEQHVEPVLESLAALGLIVGYETNAGRWWRAARPSLAPEA
jgi:hypothetical protein